MRLDIDCIRDILLTIETNCNSYGEYYYPNLIFESLSDYDEDVLTYHLLALNDGGYISCLYSDNSIEEISSLTWEGHQYLDTIRPATVWDKTKTILSKSGVSSLSMVSKIASNVALSIMKTKFPDYF